MCLFLARSKSMTGEKRRPLDLRGLLVTGARIIDRMENGRNRQLSSGYSGVIDVMAYSLE